MNDLNDSENMDNIPENEDVDPIDSESMNLDEIPEAPDDSESIQPTLQFCDSLEHEYEQAKFSIDLSRNSIEQKYWQKRSDELWEELDMARFKEYMNNKK